MRRVMISLAIGVVGSLLAMFIIGCETQSALNYAPVTITPKAVNLNVAGGTNKCVFAATGGDGYYTWTVRDPTLGYIVAGSATNKAAAGVWVPPSTVPGATRTPGATATNTPPPEPYGTKATYHSTRGTGVNAITVTSNGENAMATVTQY